jgi:hypothetical protein
MIEVDKNSFSFYVYIYLDPRKPGKFSYERTTEEFGYEKIDEVFDFEPFYIGKGLGKRINLHLKKVQRGKFSNSPKNQKINKLIKIGLLPIISKIKENLIEEEAFNFEKQFIRVIGRHDLKLGPLLNLTFGGEGSSGIIWTKESREKESKSKKGKSYNESYGVDRAKEIIKKSNQTKNRNGSGKGEKNSMSGVSRRGIESPSYKIIDEKTQKEIIDYYQIEHKTIKIISQLTSISKGIIYRIFREKNIKLIKLVGKYHPNFGKKKPGLGEKVSKKLKGRIGCNKGKKYVYKDGVNKLIEMNTIEKYLNEGWVLGKTNVPKPSQKTKDKISDSVKKYHDNRRNENV